VLLDDRDERPGADVRPTWSSSAFPTGIDRRRTRLRRHDDIRAAATRRRRKFPLGDPLGTAAQGLMLKRSAG